jgi:hypothetical protein
MLARLWSVDGLLLAVGSGLCLPTLAEVPLHRMPTIATAGKPLRASDHLHLRPDAHQREQIGNVGVVKAKTPVG